MTDRALTTSAAARYLGLPKPDTAGKRHVQRLIRRGIIKAEDHNQGGQRPTWRVRQSVLDAYLEIARKPPHSRDCSKSDNSDNSDTPATF